MQKLPITVIMLTLNEEFHLEDTIKNIRDWVEEIFVVDSCSTDKTINIALKYNVQIVQRPFTNFGDQWNFALEHLPIKTPWTIKLDPDERFTPELVEEIRRVVSSDSTEYSGYSFPRRLWFMGKPLHVVQDVVRLWRTGYCRFSDVIVNEHPIIDGKIGNLKGRLEHFDSRDLHHWWEKQNRYTTMLAIQKARGDSLSAKPKLWGSALERRMFFIELFFKIPFRYQLQWIHEVLIRGAWRSGKLGLTWARLRIESRRMRELKTVEILSTGQIPIVPEAPHGDYDPRLRDSPLQQLVWRAEET